MTEAVLDASALLAFLRDETGSDVVRPLLPTTCISAVNLAETYGKLIQHGRPAAETVWLIARLKLRVVSFDADQARLAAAFVPRIRAAGLSLGDRACLALAQALGLPVVTADAAWSACDVGVRLILIR